MAEDKDTLGDIQLEVGARDLPVIHQLRANLRAPLGSKTILIDKRVGFGGITDSSKQKEDDVLIQADALKISLADNSASVVVVKDMFGAEGYDTHAGTKVVKEKVGDVSKIVGEFERVIKPTGKIIIIETYTPSEETRTSVESSLREQGFKLIETREKQDIRNLFENPEQAHILTSKADLIEWDKAYGLVYEKQ